ncbi:MAG: GNAT family N-acetyltransferase [Paracoccaceae bacterium]
MSLRAFRDADRPALEAFLRRDVATSMFPLSNLLGSGLPMQMWIAGAAGRGAGFLGLASNGNLMPQWPGGDWAQAAPLLAGQAVAGLLGPADQCDGLMQALGLAQRARMKSTVEPGLTLRLADLVLPDCSGVRLTVATASDEAQMTRWRAQANSELLGMEARAAQALAITEVRRMIERGTHRLLWQGDRAVAMAGINAAIPGCVQVGAVFTPPDCRGLGFARRVVGLMLQGLRAEGVETACLFAASPEAVRAYRAIGFQPSHSFGIHLFASPAVITWP